MYNSLPFIVFNDGQDKEMLNLGGTIPVNYKGKDNNFDNVVRKDVWIFGGIC